MRGTEPQPTFPFWEGFDEDTVRLIFAAQIQGQEWGIPYLTSQAILFAAVASEGSAGKVLRSFGLNPAVALAGHTEQQDLHDEDPTIVFRAIEEAKSSVRGAGVRVTPSAFLAYLISYEDSRAAQYVRALGISIEDVVTALRA